MRIVIVGAGNVGYTLAEVLSSSGHDVVLIESKREHALQLENELDIQVVIGNGSQPSILEEAGVSKDTTTDVLIACSNRDEVNIMACWQAKRLGVRRVIARAMSKEYTSSRQWTTVLGINEIISPERTLAREIEEMLIVHSAVHTTEFFSGEVGSYAFRISRSSSICGKSLKQIDREFKEFHAVIVYVERGESGFTPTGDWVAEDGDLCFLVTFKEKGRQLERLFNPDKNAKKIKRILIIGGGKIGSALCSQLLASQPYIEIKLIEKDPQLCGELAVLFPKLSVLNGDGADERLLIHEGIEYMDGCVCATGSDERNIVLASLAKTLGIGKSIAIIKNKTYAKLSKQFPLDATVNPNESLVSVILRHVRYPESAGALSLIEQINAEIIEVAIPENSPVRDKSIAEMNIPKGVIFSMIRRDEEVILPRGDTLVKAGDTILIFSLQETMPKIIKMLGIKI